jgi:hypothetical protein
MSSVVCNRYLSLDDNLGAPVVFDVHDRLHKKGADA